MPDSSVESSEEDVCSIASNVESVPSLSTAATMQDFYDEDFNDFVMDVRGEWAEFDALLREFCDRREEQLSRPGSRPDIALREAHARIRQQWAALCRQPHLFRGSAINGVPSIEEGWNGYVVWPEFIARYTPPEKQSRQLPVLFAASPSPTLSYDSGSGSGSGSSSGSGTGKVSL